VSEQVPPYNVRVVKSVTLTVNSDWAALLVALQTAKNSGGRLVIVNVRDFRIAPVGEFERGAQASDSNL